MIGAPRGGKRAARGAKDRTADAPAAPAGSKPKRGRSPTSQAREPKARRGAAPARRTVFLAPYRQPPRGTLQRVGLCVLGVLLFMMYGAGFAMLAPALIILFVIPPAIIVLLGIWALPKTDKAPTGLLEPLFLFFFAALFLWPNYLALALPGLPWITMLRLTGLPLALIFLMCASMSANFRAQLGRTLTADPFVWRAYFAFVLLQVLSIAFSHQPSFSVSRFIVAQTNWTSIFLVSCFLFRAPGFAERWAAMLITLGFVLCLIGLWEQTQQHVIWVNHIPSMLKIEDQSVLITLAGTARAATNKYRVLATGSVPLQLAEFLAATTPFALHYVMDRYRLLTRLLAALYLPLALFVILLTDSRLGVVGSLVAMLVYMLIWATMRWRRDGGSLIAPAIVAAYPVIFCSVVAATFFVGRLRSTVWGNGAQSASNESRQIQWAMGIPKIIHQPWGHGIGTSASVLGYYQPGSGLLTIDSHFLGTLLDYGILGFVLYYCLFARAAWVGARAAAQADGRELRLVMPMAVSLIAFIVIKAVYTQEDNHPLFFMMIGGLLALTSRIKAARQTGRQDSLRPDRLEPVEHRAQHLDAVRP